MKSLIATVLLLIFVGLFGCAIVPPVQSEYPLLRMGVEAEPPSPDHVRVLIFNATNPVWSFANSGKDVWINGKGVARLETGQYVELFVKTGKHELKLLHQDVFDFYTTIPITVNPKERFIEICSLVGRTQARVLSSLPEGFDSSFNAFNEPATSYFALRDKPFFARGLEVERNTTRRVFCAW